MIYQFLASEIIRESIFIMYKPYIQKGFQIRHPGRIISKGKHIF